jgi:5-methyltetrahydrofolate--homocysteine methyltransferase
MTLLEQCRKGEILVADGGMGTMLFERGLRPGMSPESFMLSHPEKVREVSREFLTAGADILHTNTFGGSPLKLTEYGLADKTEEINRSAVDIVREVAGDEAIVAGSCGPSGQFMEPYGDVPEAEMRTNFRQQIEALVEGGIDVLTIETMMDVREATVAIQAAKIVAADLVVIASMTFDETSKGFFTVMGTNIEQAAIVLEEAGADIVGSNCGDGIEKMVKIADAFRSVTSLPVLIQSNAGKPEASTGGLIYPESPEFFVENVAALVESGVAIIGGCCGTTPAHIRAIREVVDRAQQ